MSEPSGRRPTGNWSDLRARAASGVLMAGMALVCLALGGFAWTVLLCALAVGLAWEWAGLAAAAGARARASAGASQGRTALVAMVGIATVSFAADCPQAAAAVLGFGLLALLAWTRRPLLAIGVAGVGLPCIALLWMRDDPVAGLANVLFAVALVWASDIGAYVSGRALGGAKLAPRISPGKTVSGALGGLICAGLAGLGVAAWARTAGLHGNLIHAGALAMLLGMVAQAGDLAESWLKRRAGAKDSSHLIPGHGGLLDRLDAIMAVAPVAAILAFTAGRGVVLWR